MSPLERANRFLKQGFVARAEDILRQSLREQPSSLPIRELLIAILQRENRSAEVMQLVVEGLGFHADHQPFKLVQARLWLEQGDAFKAEQLLVDMNGDDKTVMSLLAAALQQQQKYRDSLSVYQRLIQIDPLSSRAWVGSAIAMDVMGDQRGAIQAYREAVSLQTLPPQLAQYAQQRLAALDSGQ